MGRSRWTLPTAPRNMRADLFLMSKRFIDSSVFRKPLVRALEAPYKLLWIYLQCECDHAGFWIPEMDVASARLEVKLTEAKALEKMAGLVEVMPGGEWWVVDFCEFQYGRLRQENRAHASVMELLRSRALLGEDLQPIHKALTRPLQGPMDKEKDKDMDMDKEKDRERARETFESLWVTFERYGSKGKAYTYWQQLTEGDRAEITAKAPDYVASTPGCAYRKHLEGWINPSERRWEAPIREPRTDNANGGGLRPTATPPSKTFSDRM